VGLPVTGDEQAASESGTLAVVAELGGKRLDTADRRPPMSFDGPLRRGCGFRGGRLPAGDVEIVAVHATRGLRGGDLDVHFAL
jgi:hypothetical protein